MWVSLRNAYQFSFVRVSLECKKTPGGHSRGFLFNTNQNGVLIFENVNSAVYSVYLENIVGILYTAYL